MTAVGPMLVIGLVFGTIGAAPDGAELLVASWPGAGDVLTDAPTEIDLVFAADPGDVVVRILDEGGEVVLTAPATGTGIDRVAGTPLLPDDGDLFVAWAASAGDARGAFGFTVDRAGLGTIAVARATSTATMPLRVARVVVGAALVAVILVAASAVAGRRPVPVGVWASAGVLLGSIGTAPAGVPADGGPVDALSPSSWVDGVRDGRGWLLPLVVVGVLVALSGVRERPGAGGHRSSGAGAASRPVLLAVTLVGVVGAGAMALTGAELGGTDPAVARRLAAGPMSIDLVVEPARAGVNELHLYGIDPGGAVADLASATVWATFVDEGVGPLEVPVVRAGPNHFLTYSAVLPFDGRWELTVAGTTGAGERLRATTEVVL